MAETGKEEGWREQIYGAACKKAMDGGERRVEEGLRAGRDDEWEKESELRRNGKTDAPGEGGNMTEKTKSGRADGGRNKEKREERRVRVWRREQTGVPDGGMDRREEQEDLTQRMLEKRP